MLERHNGAFGLTCSFGAPTPLALGSICARNAYSAGGLVSERTRLGREPASKLITVNGSLACSALLLSFVQSSLSQVTTVQPLLFVRDILRMRCHLSRWEGNSFKAASEMPSLPLAGATASESALFSKAKRLMITLVALFNCVSFNQF